MPCVFTSGGGIGPSAKKIVDKIATKMTHSSMERCEDIKIDIKTDIVMILLKSRIQGIRSARNSISTQMTNFKIAQINL